MKKTYKNPTLEVVDVQANELMLNASFGEGTLDGGVAAGREADFSDWGGDEYVIDDDAMNIGF